jgi:ATP-dependent exoDNAse (exonuclease V) beta subunit
MGEPHRASLLARLWPVVRQEFAARYEAEKQEAGVETQEELDLRPEIPRMRLIQDWQCPEPPAGLRAQSVALQSTVEEAAIEFDWAGEAARHIGTVVHRLLQYLGSADKGLDEAFQELRIDTISRHLLTQAGVPSEMMASSMARVHQAVINTLQDEKGRWVLSRQHESAQNEYPLTTVAQGEVRRMVIDRTFIDEQGVRWIVDYKTSAHEGGSLEAFLDQEVERYRSQLQGYARAFQGIEDREVRTGLYFPLLQAWREVR